MSGSPRPRQDSIRARVRRLREECVVASVTLSLVASAMLVAAIDRCRAVDAAAPRTGSRCRCSGCCSCSAVGSEMLSFEVARSAALRLVPRHRAGDGAARPGARRRAGARLRARSTTALNPRSLDRLLVNVADVRDLPARSAARDRRRWSATPTRQRRTRCGSRRSCCSRSCSSNALNFVMIAAAAALSPTASRCARMLALVRHGAAVGVRDRPADRRRRLHLRPPRRRRRSASPRSCSSSSCTSCAPACRPRSAARSSTQRTRELASLQVGLLSTVLQTLSMRDAMTARHSAAVARYSREVAAMLGARRARAGPHPHRRAAARHRQVHPPGLRPVRRTAS